MTGDDGDGWAVTLKEHMDARFAAVEQQVRDAFAAVTALDEERQSALDRRLDSIRRETALIQQASDRAIEKAEAATEKRFEAGNAFREEARAVREAQQAALSKLVSELLPREVFDTTVEQWAGWRAGVDRDRARMVGQGEQRNESRLSHGALLGFGGFALAVLGTIVVLANFAFAHSGATDSPSQPGVVTVRDITPK